MPSSVLPRPGGGGAASQQLDEWATSFAKVWTFDRVLGKKVAAQTVKVIVDPGPKLFADQPPILLSSDLFHSVQRSFAQAVAGLSGGASSLTSCDQLFLAPLVFEAEPGQVLFRLTSKTLCKCVQGPGPSCALQVGNLDDVVEQERGSVPVVRIGSAIADEYSSPDAYFLSYRGPDVVPDLVLNAVGGSFGFDPPSFTGSLSDGVLRVDAASSPSGSFLLDVSGHHKMAVSLQASRLASSEQQVLPLGVLSPAATALGERSYLGRILDRARELDPLADSVNFMWDGAHLRFSNRLRTSVWSDGSHDRSTEPLLLGANFAARCAPLGAVLSLGGAAGPEALPGGGWALRTFAEDSSLDPFENPTGNDVKNDLLDEAELLLSQVLLLSCPNGVVCCSLQTQQEHSSSPLHCTGPHTRQDQV